MDQENELIDLIRDLVMCHSPGGVESKIDAFLLKRFAELGINVTIDASGNFVARIPRRSELWLTPYYSRLATA